MTKILYISFCHECVKSYEYNMELVIKRRFIFLVFLIIIIFMRCKPEKDFCYYVKILNFPTELPSRAPVFYAIENYQVLQQIKGKHIIDNYYQSKINNIKIIKGIDTLDSNDGGYIKLREISGVMCIRFQTARFQMFYKDSASAMLQIKKEKIVLELNNGKIIKLDYCRNRM